jgi:CheY-like chemotaxis protein
MTANCNAHAHAHDIVIIEDDAGIRESLKDLLEMEGFSVQTAANGAEGLQLIGQIDRPCLILLDLMMPVMDGWEFLEVMKSRPDSMLATIPVTVVSAAADLGDIKGRYGCEVIRKPVDIDRLLGVAQQFCGCAR